MSRPIVGVDNHGVHGLPQAIPTAIYGTQHLINSIIDIKWRAFFLLPYAHVFW